MLRRRPILKAEVFGMTFLTTRTKAVGFFRIPFPLLSGPHQLNLVYGWPALPNSACLSVIVNYVKQRLCSKEFIEQQHLLYFDNTEKAFVARS